MIYLATGRRELGKTTLALSLAQRSRCAVVLDPRHQLPSHDSIRDLPEDLGVLDQRWCDGASILIVQPARDLQRSTDVLAAWAWDVVPEQQGQLAIVVDEAGLLSLETPAWSRLLRCAPRDRVHVIATAHRPRDYAVLIRSIADVWCLFRTTQEHDLRVIAERCGEDTADIVRGLAPREWVCWDDRTETRLVYRDPSTWFVDLRTFGGVKADVRSVETRDSSSIA